MRQPLAAALAAAALGACGYTTGFGLQSGVAIHDIAVEVVGNRTFRQRLEIELTRRIHEALPVYTGLVPVSQGAADAVLRVEILEVHDQTLVVGNDPPVLEGALVFAVRAQLLNARTRTVLRDRKILDRAEFRRPISETSRTARQESLTDLARKIVLSLEPDL